MTASKTDYITISSSSSSDEQKMNPWVKRTIFVAFGALAFYAGTIYSSTNNKNNNNNNNISEVNLVRSGNGGGISNSDGGGITGEAGGGGIAGKGSYYGYGSSRHSKHESSSLQSKSSNKQGKSSKIQKA